MESSFSPKIKKEKRIIISRTERNSHRSMSSSNRSVSGVYVEFCLLPFKFPPKEELPEMSQEAKMNFYALPLDLQNYLRLFKPPKEVDDTNDEQLWFAKKPCKLVPYEEPAIPKYGGDLDEAKSHLDYHNPSGVSEEEMRAWKAHHESLPPNSQCIFESFINKDIGQPSHSQAQRGFHSTRAERMGGHGHDEPAYLHSKHMYNLDRMKSQKLTMSLSVFTAFSIGVGVPIYAVIFQQKKTASA